MKLRIALVVAVAAAFVAAPAAGAHVEVTPESVPADSDAELTFNAPNEKDIPFVKLSIQLPAGLDEVTYEPMPGWQTTRTQRTLTWSGGRVAPGQFQEFKIITHVPNKPGQVLVFPAVQTYSDGSSVHWIGEPSSDTPAPRVTLAAAESTTTTTTTSASTTRRDDSSDAGLWVAIAALVVGVGALGLGLFRWRRA